MKDISKIDTNFKRDTNLSLDDVCFYNVTDYPWCVFGLINDSSFIRIPEKVARNVNESVAQLYTNTAGGRVRFSTNSPYVAICAVMPDRVSSSHIPDTAISGFDMSVDGKYCKTFIPPTTLSEGFEGVIHFENISKRNITINFPLYNAVHELYIGLKKGSTFKEHTPYKNSQKIVFYGSSITQGGCVSRPGLAYPAQICAKLDCDYLNLGFSAGAKGELCMAEYIAELNPDILVMDYDHNAPSPEFLENTHEPFFKAFRSIQKNTPVVFTSAPNVRFMKPDWIDRKNVIFKTYENALNSGDKNVYFIDGKELWGNSDWRLCTVDGCHPNDLGHYRTARKLIPIIKKIRRI